MTKIQLANSQYLYKHVDWEGPHPLDTHHIVIQRNSARIFLVHLFALLLFINAIYLCLLNGTLGTIFLLSMLSSACLFKSYYGTLIEKESVVIIPSLGVQLEAHYWSGRVVRSFIPFDKILKPVLNENVTPFTCYWSLVLLVCGKKELIFGIHGSKTASETVGSHLEGIVCCYLLWRNHRFLQKIITCLFLAF